MPTICVLEKRAWSGRSAGAALLLPLAPFQTRNGVARRQRLSMRLCILGVTWLWSAALWCTEVSAIHPGSQAASNASARASTSSKSKEIVVGLDREKLLQVSAQLSRGYYQALFDAEFAQAAGFLHPEFLAQMQNAWLQRVQSAKPAAQKKHLADMGLQTLSEATLLSGIEFFARYATSPDGIGLRRLSEPGLLQMRAVVENQACEPSTQSCEVLLRIKGKKESGAAISAPQTLWVRFAEGKFWVDSRASAP